MSNYIIHWGIKGQKWGIRRYRNTDGTLTEAGKRRYDRDIRENLSKKKDNRVDTSKPDPNRWVKEDLTSSRNLVRESKNLVTDLDTLERTTRGSGRKTKKMDLSKMSDKEMRDKINRELLERQYDQLFSEDNKSNRRRGREIVSDTLSVAGGVLGVAGSSLAIALAMKELRGK